MTIRGYARVSTADAQQAGLEAQVRDLTNLAQATDIEQERISAVSKARPGLQALFDRLQPGDVLAVTKLDRLARSTTDLLRIVDHLQQKQVGLIILSMSGQQVDTRSPTGLLLLTMLGAIAAFERSLLLERQREGIERAKLQGKYTGRKGRLSSKFNDLEIMVSDGMRPATAAKHLKIGRSTAYRHLKSLRNDDSQSAKHA